VFATLTAPSFGPVHARRMRGKTVLPCRPRRDADARRCPHGRDVSCPARHAEAERSITRAQARDKVKRNVVLLCDVPQGQEGRPSKSLTYDQAAALLAAAEDRSPYAYIVVSLLTGAESAAWPASGTHDHRKLGLGISVFAALNVTVDELA
jgi:hypothetical protein